jgi:hypothetical protein
MVVTPLKSMVLDERRVIVNEGIWLIQRLISYGLTFKVDQKEELVLIEDLKKIIPFYFPSAYVQTSMFRVKQLLKMINC